MSNQMTAKKAGEIATQNGYQLGRNGKNGYYLGFVNEAGQYVHQPLPAEANLSAVVRYIQANPNSSVEYREYLDNWTRTMPVECVPMTYQRWLQATAKQEAQAALYNELNFS